jgi:phosphoglycerate dehydrogenase-like enzyme
VDPSALTVLVIAHHGDPMLAVLREAGPGVEFVVGDDAGALTEAAPRAAAVLVLSGDCDTLQSVLAIAPRVGWVHSWATGVDGFLFPALVASDVVLTNTRGVYSVSLAEFAIGAMLYFAKDFARMKRSQGAEVWDPFDVAMLRGATLGIIGFGDIGRAVAMLGHAAGMNILALRRRPELSAADPLGPEMVASKGAICERSDYLVLAAPLTPETRHLIGREELRAMRRSAVLVNIGRGALVDQAALVSALEHRALKGAALDVFEREPLQPGHPLFRLDNVLLSPHCADHTATWRDDAMRCFLDNLTRFRAGKPLENVVDKANGY